jgi:hypothetical protein
VRLAPEHPAQEPHPGVKRDSAPQGFARAPRGFLRALPRRYPARMSEQPRTPGIRGGGAAMTSRFYLSRLFGALVLISAALLFSSQLALAQSQRGPKLVGTGAVGSAAQGVSVALSADGSTAIVGGYDDNSGTGAAWVF